MVESAIKLLTGIVNDVPVGYIAVDVIAKFAASGVKMMNSKLRKSAILLTKVLYKHAGDDILPYLTECNLEDELSEVAFDPPADGELLLELRGEALDEENGDFSDEAAETAEAVEKVDVSG